MAATETLTTALAPAVRAAVRNLILVLADSKRLLGMRYGEWILGAPELEAGIACASMAQDEWGHARLLYALLRDFDDDVHALELTRDPHEYASMEALDAEPADWPGLVALNALVDTALSVQCEALRGSAYPPIAQRVGKLLDEERFHDAHGVAWFRRLARGGDEARAAIFAAAAAILPGILAWFGPDSERARLLAEAGIAQAAGSELRARYLERIAPLLALLGDAGAALNASVPEYAASGLAGFDEARRRTAPGGPDAATIAKIRGDKNREFLVD
jgi:ring-1,2-phenylacetyl-CoA epoxidase subunit PaaC